MPDDLNCFGASTGNICTVRCRNNALAGPFGGCFAVQQSDTDKKTNTPQNIKTTQQLKAINAQVQQNIKDFPDSVEANENANSDEAAQNKAAVDALLGNTVVTSAFAVETPTIALGRPPAATPDPNEGNNGDNNGDNNNNGGNNGGNNGDNDDNNNGGNNRGGNGGNGGQGQGQGNGQGNGGNNGQGGNGGNGGNNGGNGNPFGRPGGFPGFGGNAGGNGGQAKRGLNLRWAKRTV
ncbi:hypothetical protein ACHAPQ_009283 [Fusarium lateritium]